MIAGLARKALLRKARLPVAETNSSSDMKNICGLDSFTDQLALGGIGTALADGQKIIHHLRACSKHSHRKVLDCLGS